MGVSRRLVKAAKRPVASGATKLGLKGECSKTLPRGWGTMVTHGTPTHFGLVDPEVEFSRGCSYILSAFGLDPPKRVFFGPAPASPAYLRAEANKAKFSGVQRPRGSRVASRYAAKAYALFEARRQRAAKVHSGPVTRKRKVGPSFKPAAVAAPAFKRVFTDTPAVPFVVPDKFRVAYVPKGTSFLPAGTRVFEASKPASRTLGFSPARVQREYVKLSLGGWSVSLDTVEGVVTDSALLTLMKGYHFEAFLPLRLLARNGVKLTPMLDYGWVKYERAGSQARLIKVPCLWEVLLLNKRGSCGPKLRAYIESFKDNNGYCYLKLFRMANIAIGRSARKVGLMCSLLGAYPSTQNMKMCLYRHYSCIPDFYVGYSSASGRGHMTTLPVVRVSALPDLCWGSDRIMFGSVTPDIIQALPATSRSPVNRSPASAVTAATPALSKSAQRRLRRKMASGKAEAVSPVKTVVNARPVTPVIKPVDPVAKLAVVPVVKPVNQVAEAAVTATKAVKRPTDTFIKPLFKDVKREGNRLKNWFSKVNPNLRVKDRLTALLSTDGSGYDYKGGSHKPDRRSAALLKELSAILRMDLSWVKHALVQKYKPGSKIGAHKDNEPCYYPLSSFRLVTINVFGEALFTLTRGTEKYNIGLDGPSMFEIDPSVNFNFNHSVEVGRFHRGSITLRGHKPSSVIEAVRVVSDKKRHDLPLVGNSRVALPARTDLKSQVIGKVAPSVGVPGVRKTADAVRAVGDADRSEKSSQNAEGRTPAVTKEPLAVKRASNQVGVSGGVKTPAKTVKSETKEPGVNHMGFVNALTNCYSVGDTYDRVKFKDYNPVCQKHTYGLVHIYYKGTLVKKGVFRRYYDLKALRQLCIITDNLRNYISSFRDTNGYCYLTYIRVVAMYFGLAESECAAATKALGPWPKASNLISYISKRYGSCPAIKVGYSHVSGVGVHANLNAVFLLANMRGYLRVGGRLPISATASSIKIGSVDCPIRISLGSIPASRSGRYVKRIDSKSNSAVRMTNVGLGVSTIRAIATEDKSIIGHAGKLVRGRYNNGTAGTKVARAGLQSSGAGSDSNVTRRRDAAIALRSLTQELVDRVLDFSQTEPSLDVEKFKDFDVRCVVTKPGLVRVYHKGRLVRALMAERYWDIHYLRTFGDVSRNLNSYLKRFSDDDGHCYMKILRLCCIYFSRPMSFVGSAKSELGYWPSSIKVKSYIVKRFKHLPDVFISLSRGKFAHVGLLPRLSVADLPDDIRLGGHVEKEVSLRRMTEVDRLNLQVEKAQLKDSVLLRAVENTLVEEHTLEHQLQRTKTQLNVNVWLSDSQQAALVKSFPELKLKFVPTVHSLHPMSTAVRMCFNSLYAKKLGTNKYIDIGGDLKYHIMRGGNVHVCNPILDPKDGVRYVNRVCEWNNAKATDLKSMMYGVRHVSCCYSPAQVCKVSCNTAVAVEVYDISLHDMAKIMLARGIDRVFLTMMIPGELFDDNSETVCVPEHGISVSQDGDNLIYSMPAGQSYCHDRSSVLSYINNPYLLHGGQLFHSELVGHRCGVCEFRVTRVPVYPAVNTVVHVTVPRATAGLVELHLPNIDKYSDVLSFERVTSVMIDYEFFTRALCHIINVCTNVSEKTFEYVMTWLRNNSARVVISGRIIHTNVKLAPEHLGNVAALLLATAVKYRWESGRYARRLYRAVGQETLWESIKAAVHESTSTVKATAYELVKTVLTSSFPFLGDLQSRSVEEFFTVLGESVTVKRTVNFPSSGGYIVGESKHITCAVDAVLEEALRSSVLSQMSEIVEDPKADDHQSADNSSYVPPNKRGPRSGGLIREKVKAVAGLTDRCDGSKPGQGAGIQDAGSSLFIALSKVVGRYVTLTLSKFRNIVEKFTAPFPGVQSVLISVFNLWGKLRAGDPDVWVTYGATVVYTVIRSIVYLILGHSPFGVCLGLMTVLLTPLPPVFTTDRDNLACDTLFEAIKGGYFAVPLTSNKWVNRVLSVLENIGYFKSLVRRAIAVLFDESTAASVVILIMPPEENVWAAEQLMRKAYCWIYDQIQCTLDTILDAVPKSARRVVSNTICEVSGGISSVLASSILKVTDWFTRHHEPTSLGSIDADTEDFFSMADDITLSDDILSETPGLRGGLSLNKGFFVSLIRNFVAAGQGLIESIMNAVFRIKSLLYPLTGSRSKKGSELLEELFRNGNSEEEEFKLAEVYLQEFFDVDLTDCPGTFGGAVDCKSFALSVYKFFKSFKFDSIVAMCQAVLAWFVLTKNRCMKTYRDASKVAEQLIIARRKKNPGFAIAKLADSTPVKSECCYRVSQDMFDADAVIRSLSASCKPKYFPRKEMKVYRVPAAIDYDDSNALAANLVSAPFDFLMCQDDCDVKDIGLDFNLIKRMLGWAMTKDLVSRIPLARRLHPNAILMVRKGGYAIFDKNRRPVVYNCPDVRLTPEKMDVVFMRLSGGLMGGGVLTCGFLVFSRMVFNSLEKLGIISERLNLVTSVISCALSPIYRWYCLLRWLLDTVCELYQEDQNLNGGMEVKCINPVTPRSVNVSQDLKQKYSEVLVRELENVDALVEGLVHQPADGTDDADSSDLSSTNSDGERYNERFFRKKKNSSKKTNVSAPNRKGKKGGRDGIVTKEVGESSSGRKANEDRPRSGFNTININDECSLRMGDLYNRREYQIAEVIQNLDLSCPPVFTHTSDLVTNAMNEFVFMHMMNVLNMMRSMKTASKLLMGDTRDPCLLTGDMVDPKVVILDTSTNMLKGTNMGVKNLKDTEHRFCYDPNSESLVSLGAYRVKSCNRYIVLHEDLEVFYANKVLHRFNAGIKMQKTHYLQDLVVVETPPGGGKTTQLVALFFGLWMKGVAVRVITANKNSAQEIRRKTCALARQFKVIEPEQTVKVRQLLDDMVRTADSTIMNVLSAQTEVLLVDEIFLMHLGQLVLNFEILKPHFVVGYGDSKQIGYIARTDLYCANYFNVMAIVEEDQIQYRSESYRCPKDVCALLSQLYGRNIEARANSNTKTMSVTSITSVEDVPVVDDAKYLVYTQGEKRSLETALKKKGRIPSPYLDPQTVHEAQGNTYKKVLLVRTKPQDDDVFSSLEHQIVALSRHTDSLVYYCISSKYNDETAAKIERSKTLAALNANEINEQPIIGGKYENDGGNPATGPCRAGGMGWQAIISFLEEVVPGSTVLSLTDISDAMSTSEFESCVDKIRVSENMTVGKRATHSGRQRVRRD
uniref:Polyprotein n=1 Tax=Olivavirus actinidiae TaxID=2024724 RepID=A0A7L9CDS3_9CLOS|nr:polyprotein [Actinidia virus 1]